MRPTSPIGITFFFGAAMIAALSLQAGKAVDTSTAEHQIRAIEMVKLQYPREPDFALEQEYAARLRSPATARGLVGGESHNTYVIRVRKGQTMTVQISWRREHDNESENHGDKHAEFWVGESPNFDGDKAVLGKESNDGKRWSCKIPKAGNYYIYVTAHPRAHYTLRVTVR